MALEWDDWVGLLVAALAAVLFLIAIRAYRTRPTKRVALFAGAFGLFFAKGLLVIVELATGDIPTIDAIELLADAGILALFFAGMLQS